MSDDKKALQDLAERKALQSSDGETRHLANLLCLLFLPMVSD